MKSLKQVMHENVRTDIAMCQWNGFEGCFSAIELFAHILLIHKHAAAKEEIGVGIMKK